MSLKNIQSIRLRISLRSGVVKNVKITDLTLYKLPPRWLFLKIETDEGICGWGEPIVEGSADIVRSAVQEYGKYLIGKDPMRIQDHWQAMYRAFFYRGGPIYMSAIAGIDQALWDIKGKYYNAPIYDLIGGLCRDRLKVYRWIGCDSPNELKQRVTEAYEQGYRAIKMNATAETHWIDSFKKVQEVCERIAVIRELYGYDMDVAVDFHGRVHKSMAKVMAHELEAFHLMFIEEPVLSQNYEALCEISCHTSTPIALGERLFTRWDYKPIFESGYVDIIQPDLSHAGGISECLTLARMAEAYDVSLAPHCPLGPIALAACINVDCVSPNAFIQEQSMGIHYNRNNELLDYLNDASIYKYDNGFIDIVPRPGLGVDVNEDYVKEVSERFDKENGDWKNPVWRIYDGTIAEW